MHADGWSAPGGSQRVLSPEQVDALFTDAAELSALDPRGGPLPAVLDTDFIRTGLHDQLKQGKLPMSVRQVGVAGRASAAGQGEKARDLDDSRRPDPWSARRTGAPGDSGDARRKAHNPETTECSSPK